VTKIRKLMTRLSNAKAGSKTLPAAGKYLEEAVEKLAAALADEIAAEDPQNGEVTLRMIDLPFITAADKAEVASSA
jgi:hypothetical protein